MQTKQTTTHTPGPWQTTGLLIFAQRNPGGRKVYLADASQDAGLHASLANARLIAVAPDLLATLKRIAALYSPNEIGHQASDIARAAIVKAEGTNDHTCPL